MTLTAAGPMYARPVNRCREIDFDDELFTIFYSVLRHVHEEYGFGELRNPGFSLLTPVQFRRYLGGFGVIRLKQIRGRYFSDQALRMWDLCFSFFEHQHEIRVHANRQEYLLARKFEVVFEAMIDALIGDPRSMIPEGLKDQDDGKRVDHMYRYAGLEDVDADGGVEKSVYYIGDSKYYKRRDKISSRSEAVYKQFTYARNVIQWNLDLFLDAEEKGEIAPGTKVHKGERRLRNEATEGYAVIPNFFISGRIENDLRYDHREVKPVKAEDGKRKEYFARQFENRLFDRDTFLIAHYDVNFLYVLSLYAKNNAAKRKAWRDYVRNEFRNRIRTMLQENYEFYAMTPRGDTDPEAFFRENFKEVIGRVFDPYGKRNGFDYYSVAVRKSDATHDFSAENEALLGLLETKFKIKPCDLGVKPETVIGLEGEARRVTVPVADDRRTFHWLENYKDADIVLGFCKGDDHLKWMLGRDGGKESDMYNLRADKDRAGSVNVRDPKTRNAKFLILYFASSEEDNKCRVFRISKGVTKGRQWLLDTGYPHDPATEATAGKRYYCYYLDEEVSLGELAIGQLLIMKRHNREQQEMYHKGEPVFVKGSEILAIRVDPPIA